MKKERLKNIEFLRFFFAVSIVYFHLLHSFMMPYTQGAEIYQLLADQSRYTKYIVECFFIMSGCFLYRSLLARPDQTAWDFLTKKILRLWPVLAVSTVLSVVFLDVPLDQGILNLFFLQSTGLTTGWKGLNWYVSAFFFAEVFTVLSVVFLDVPLDQGILNLFFLQSTGLTTGWKGLNWYVSAFFFAEVFYFLLYKVMKNSKAMKLLICLLVYFGGLTTGWKGLNWYVSAFFFAEVFYFLLYKVMKNSKAMKLLICLLVYFGHVLNITSTDGGFGRAVVYGVFSLAMARAVAGVGLGYLLGNIYDSLKKRIQTAAPEAKKKLIQWISLVFSLAMARAVAGVGLGYLLGNIYDSLKKRIQTAAPEAKKKLIQWISLTEIISFLGAVAGVGLGYLLGNIYDSLKKRIQTAAPEAKKKLIQWISLTEIISFLGLLYDFFMGKAAGKNQFVVVILFSALFLCMLTEKGILSRLTSRIPLWKFGKYAYSIYVMQETAFYILEKTLWKNTELLKEHPGAALLFSRNTQGRRCFFP